jgi:hypothetical protein
MAKSQEVTSGARGEPIVRRRGGNTLHPTQIKYSNKVKIH